MAGTWIVCPNLWGARLFEYDTRNPEAEIMSGIHSGIKLIREFPRPSIRTRLEDFHDDDEVEEIAELIEDPALERKVANEVAAMVSVELERGAGAGEFSGVILCAEPHFLKILSDRLGEKARARVLATVPYDLYEVNETDLINYVIDAFEAPTPKGKLAG